MKTGVSIPIFRCFDRNKSSLSGLAPGAALLFDIVLRISLPGKPSNRLGVFLRFVEQDDGLSPHCYEQMIARLGLQRFPRLARNDNLILAGEFCFDHTATAYF